MVRATNYTYALNINYQRIHWKRAIKKVVSDCFIAIDACIFIYKYGQTTMYVVHFVRLKKETLYPSKRRQIRRFLLTSTHAPHLYTRSFISLYMLLPKT